MTIITPTGIAGITSITSTGNTLQFQNASGNAVNVSGVNVTSGTDINVSGIVTASGFVGNVTGNLSGNVTGNVNATGVSTLTTLRATSVVGVNTLGVTTAYVAQLAGVGAGTSIQIPSGSKLVGLTTGSVYAPGSIIQVVQVIPSPTSTATTGTGSNAFNMTTANSTLVFSGSITPSSSSNKILINFKTAADANAVGSEEVFAAFRGSTLLAAHSWYRRVQSDEPQTHHILYLDSPATTSSVQYDIRVATNGSYNVYVNRDANNTSSNFFNNNTSLILMEVAG